MERYKEPMIKEKSFNCPHCGAFAGQEWDEMDLKREEGSCKFYRLPKKSSKILMYDSENESLDLKDKIYISTCLACNNYCLWLNGEIVYPEVSSIPMPSLDMPEKAKEFYNEARIVFPKSKRSASALLRIGLQYLCKDLGGSGKDMNTDICKLVEMGLPIQVKQALNIMNALKHEEKPGTINENEDEKVAIKLFDLMNFIVEEMIVRPREIANLCRGLSGHK